MDELVRVAAGEKREMPGAEVKGLDAVDTEPAFAGGDDVKGGELFGRDGHPPGRSKISLEVDGASQPERFEGS